MLAPRIACALALLLATAAQAQTGMIISRGQNHFGPSPTPRWHDFFCIAREVCAVGDFNGDGADDILTFVRETGLVHVALANPGRNRFEPSTIWSRSFCRGEMTCVVGDANGDGRDDIFAIDSATGAVQVALSNGAGAFTPSPVYHHARFCRMRETCRVADVNGDKAADLIAFVKSSRPEPEAGDVYVSLASASGFAPGRAKWHDYFCIGDEVCDLGDFNGDGRADVVAFVRRPGRVWVALAKAGSVGFQASRQMHQDFCRGDAVCAVGDFDGNGADDLITFLRDTGGADPPVDFRGDVYTALSRLDPNPEDGLGGFAFSPAGMIRHDFFCIGQEICGVGDFNGDGRDDIITFLRDTNPRGRGNVYVALSEFGRTTNWELRLSELTVEHAEESGGDEPYLVAIGFRSTLGRRGSTRTFVNRFRNDEWAEDLRSGQSRAIPARMGVLRFDSVRLPTAGEIARGRAQPEMLGAVVLAFDSDGSQWGLVDVLADRVRAALQTELARVVEGTTLADLRDPNRLTGRLGAAGQRIRNSLEVSIPDIVAAWAGSWTDPDDFIGLQIFGALATDKEVAALVSFPVERSLSLGILGESDMTSGERGRILCCDNPRVDNRVRYRVTAALIHVP